MAVTVTCEGCGKTLQVADEPAGRPAACPECGLALVANLTQAGRGGAEVDNQTELSSANGAAESAAGGSAMPDPAARRRGRSTWLAVAGVAALAVVIALVVTRSKGSEKDTPGQTPVTSGQRPARPGTSPPGRPSSPSGPSAAPQQPDVVAVKAPPGWTVTAARVGLPDQSTSAFEKPEYAKWLRVRVRNDLDRGFPSGWRLAAADCLLVNGDDPAETHRCLGVVDPMVRREGARAYRVVPHRGLASPEAFLKLPGPGRGEAYTQLCREFALKSLSAGDQVALYLCFPEEAARPGGSYVLQIAGQRSP